MVPVASQIGGVLRYDDDVAHPDLDDPIAAGADVLLTSLVRLDRVDDLRLEFRPRRNHPKNAHATTARVSSTKPTTKATSNIDLSCF